jgi:flagellar hook-basal body complex protein FliE
MVASTNTPALGGAPTPLPDMSSTAGRSSDGGPTGSFAQTLQATVDAIANADGLAARVAVGNGDVLAASIARAKADAMLEAAAVSAAKIGSALNTLLQTQV